MKRSDEAVDRLLASLGNVEVPHGLEARVLDRLRERERTRPAQRWATMLRLQRLGGGRLASGWSAACVVASLATCVVALTLAKPGVRRLDTHRDAKAQKAADALASRREWVMPSHAEENPMAASVARATANTANTADVAHVRRVASRPRERRLAIARDREPEVRAKPAAAVSLTEQEKLLQRVARKGNPDLLAMLDPEARARQEAEDKAQFQRFFATNREVDHN